MGKPIFGGDFKRDAVHQITVRGYPVRSIVRLKVAARMRVVPFCKT